MGCCLNSRQYSRYSNVSDFLELLGKEKDFIKNLLNQNSIFENEVENMNYKKNLSNLYTALNYLDKKLTEDRDSTLSRNYLNGVVEILDDYYDIRNSKLEESGINKLDNKIKEFIENNKTQGDD